MWLTNADRVISSRKVPTVGSINVQRFSSQSQQQGTSRGTNDAVRCQSMLLLEGPNQHRSGFAVNAVRIADQPFLLEGLLNLHNVRSRKKRRRDIQQPLCRVIR